MSFGPLGMMILLILFLTIHFSSGQEDIVHGIGIKQCKLRCIERGGCLVIAYNTDKLACHLSHTNWMGCTEREGHISYSKQGNKFPAGACTLLTCKLNTRCVERRRSGAVCVEVSSLCDIHTTSKSGDVNCEQRIGRTPVMWAAGGGNREMVELLASKGDNVKFIDSFGIDILHSACLVGDAEVLNSVLSQRMVDINDKVRCGRTAVMLAAEYGHKDLVELLGDKGADVSLVDRAGGNILHCASIGGDVEVVNYILSKDIVDINRRGHPKKTPVMIAGQNGHKEVVALLVQHGANLLLRDKRRNNVLHLVCSEGHLDVVKYIMSLGTMDIESRGYKRRTPVMLAGKGGHKEVVDFLVKHRVNLSPRDERDYNILHLACSEGHLDVVKYIMSLDKMDINRKGYKKKTPVMLAGERGHKQVVEFLVKQGASLSPRSSNNENILHLACLEGQLDVVKYIVSLDKMNIDSGGCVRRTPVITAGKRGHKEVVEFLVRHGANLSIRDKNHNTILHPACWEGHLDLVKYIVSLGTMDIDSGGYKKRTPVMFAGIGRHKELVQFLVKHGASLSLRNSDNENILHYTCFGGSVDVMKYLLSLNAVDINSRDSHERTPVMIAGIKGHKGLVELFVSYGASLSLTDMEGDNILHLSSAKGHLEVVRYILSLGILNINVKNTRGDSAVRKARRHRDVVDLLVSQGAHK